MAEKVQTFSLSGCGESNSVNESTTDFDHEIDLNSIMNSSQISTASSTESGKAASASALGQNSKVCRFPKLEECAHFHYERVQLGAIVVRLVDEKIDTSGSSQVLGSVDGGKGSNFWFILRVSARRSETPFLIKRSLENLRLLDEMLHRCVYDRKVSGLPDLANIEAQFTSENNENSKHKINPTLSCLDDEEELVKIVAGYFNQFSAIASDSMTCGPVLTWLQLDNKGRRLPVADMMTMTTINTPAVGAAYGVRKYVAQACDEISIEVGDMISVIDMPSAAESIWWRGKKSHLQKSQYEVGFFPQSCVATIGEKIPRHMPLPAPLVGSLALSPTKPVLRKHGKLIAFFRSFILSRPSRRRLKQSGIYKERVFSCDLSEHLLNSGQEIPMVLKCCAEFIEHFGTVDGIYRLSGITSNIQKLRRAFDEERIPDLNQADIKQDIHAVSSLLKMYFRELPNPLCTYQLYDKFVDAIQTRNEDNERLNVMKETVQKLPPPHYRTLKYLASHLHKISKHASNTGMTDRNLAIVWAPNLLRSPALESGGVAALRGVGVQAVVTEFLITNSESIFDEDFVQLSEYESLQQESMTDSDSLVMERDLHESLSVTERPKSLNVGSGTKLISLEEAQSRQGRPENIDKAISINTPQCTSYIEVGGGPSSLPDKYHTVLPVPRSWQKRKTHSWKSLFSRGPRPSNSNTPISAKDIKVILKPSEKPEKLDKLKGKEKIQRKDIVHLIEIDKSPITKSVDVFDVKSINMDVCVRSNSVDSLRTAGHSRSVSHDSYFDLLQSPLRGIVNCPSKELSELGINFDREEPEMRLFSESESLVSSPRLAKEIGAAAGTGNGVSCRRVYRARPDEFCSTANSVNPSPKKQPRLNLPGTNDWYSGPMSMESLCKRYKLEDQLSDIQFIDCSTPEHQGINPTYSSSSSLSQSLTTTTKFNTNAQVHNPPTSFEAADKDKDINSSNDTIVDETICNKNVSNRSSYPQYLGIIGSSNQKRVDKTDSGRFSYPVTLEGSKQTRQEFNTRRYGFQEKEERDSKDELSLMESVLDHFDFREKANKEEDGSKQDLLAVSTQSLQATITPSSPYQSPRYSILTGGDTSSENYSESGSVTNLPNLNMNSGGSGLMESSITSTTKLIEDKQNVKEDHKVGDFVVETNNEGDEIQLVDLEKSFIDISALKRKFSLDLDTPKKMSIDLDSIPIVVAEECKQSIHIPSTPDSPNNCTQTSGGNTSQSMTPSDFGYHYLNRNSNIGTPTTPISGNTNEVLLNQEFSQILPSVMTLQPKSPSSSPIKSTISITYKSPGSSPIRETVQSFEEDEKTDDNDCYEEVEVEKGQLSLIAEKEDRPLETSFDETMVYERVKFFKSAVSEINDFLDRKPNETTQIVPELDHDKASPKSIKFELEHTARELDNKSPDDVTMTTADNPDLPDSLEFDNNLSLYENVVIEKPPAVYENLEMDRNLSAALIQQQVMVSPDGPKLIIKDEEKKPGNMVKQLATKFESPVESLPPFDFTKPSSANYLRQQPKRDSGNHHSLTMNNSQAPQSLTAAQQQTSPKSSSAKSLDENAFVREFGGTKFVLGTTQDQETENNQNNENILPNNRRMSQEYAKPKSLNPPKKLPMLEDPVACKPPTGFHEVSKGAVGTMCRDDVDVEVRLIKNQSFEKITPTTENRISLIQQDLDKEDDRSSTASTQSMPPSSNVVLNSCKLDRERIEKIKEERRHQLNEKFRSESFKGEKEYNRLKSKSKTELTEKDASVEADLRARSKSKADISAETKLNSGLTGRSDLFTNQLMRADRKTITLQDRMRRTSESGDGNFGANERMENTWKLKNKFEKNNHPIMARNQERETPPQFSIKDVAAIFESRN